ncbi:hypothetical protein K402DRAFT_383475 [Aulographum hederae CBS 113979]|uniref:K Homology domain-containing protein n=1 Tax=Aulographum hederae CBS 113979 TaxID=1176131 RepID=A0A6G1GQL7_9PEZI|nr:hypothetical protein K402DRAFT_383475 [Aulographum hederae CBS 113979]
MGRSRFDQEPDAQRSSRSRRRSRTRSPDRRGASYRQRSRLRSSSTDRKAAQAALLEEKKKEAEEKKKAALQAALEKANLIKARIDAQMKDAPLVQTPPARSSSIVNLKSPSAEPNSSSKPAVKDVYQQDGDFIKDIEINDLRNRYTLTKGETQKMIKDETGADVTTRGAYYPDKSMATAANPPIYLHVTSTTKEGLDKAIKKINDLMEQELPNLIDERRFRRREPEAVERDELGRRKWPEERIPIDLEPIPGFNLRAQVVGPQGANVKYISTETRCRVQIKGRGSGFMENATGAEADEPMYLHISGPDPKEVARAKEEGIALLQRVKVDYDEFKERGPSQRQNYNGGRTFHDRGDRGDRGHRRDSNHYNQQHRQGYEQQAQYGSPSVAATPATPATPVAYDWSQYLANNPGVDPYAAYGGYENYCNWYMQQQQQYYAAQNGMAPGTTPTPSAIAPPRGLSAPPPSAEAPPPPPPEPALPPPPPPPGF